MRNFGSDLIFIKEIKVVRENKIERVEDSNIKYAIEGGNLIENIQTKVVVYPMQNQADTLFLTTERADVVHKTGRNKNREYLFNLTPKFNERYYVSGKNKLSELYQLPAVVSYGCNAKLVQMSHSMITLGIAYSIDPADRNNDYYAAITHSGNVVFIKSYKFNGLNFSEFGFQQK